MDPPKKRRLESEGDDGGQASGTDRPAVAAGGEWCIIITFRECLYCLLYRWIKSFKATGSFQ